MSKQASRNREWTDEYTLLCEKCGYVIEGLDITGRCPECGKSIEESLPERRVGTPWQQNPGLKSLTQTWWMTLRHPIKTLSILDCFDPSLRLLNFATNLSAIWCAFAWAMSWYFMIFIQPTQKTSIREDYADWFIIGFMGCFGVYLVSAGTLWTLTQIEATGLTKFGTMNHFRVPRDQARSICAHGAVGWIVSSSLAGMTLIIMTFIHAITDLSISTSAYSLAMTIAIPGFLFFECFAYFGLRRCKFANRMKPEGVVNE